MLEWAEKPAFAPDHPDGEYIETPVVRHWVDQLALGQRSWVAPVRSGFHRFRRFLRMPCCR
jgi:hypothetical protein